MTVEIAAFGPLEDEPRATREVIPVLEESLRLRRQIDCPRLAALCRAFPEPWCVRARDEDRLLEQVDVIPAKCRQLAEAQARCDGEPTEERDRCAIGEPRPQPGEFVVREVARSLLLTLRPRARRE